jgi:phosphotriesterase-related protein
MTSAMTATGPRPADELGFTLMHEHVFLRWPPMAQQYPELFQEEEEVGKAVSKLKAARALGVRSLVDLTPIDLGRDARLLRRAAEGSGINLIVATGFYWHGPSYFRFRPREMITELLLRDITKGISSTGVRAGIIKCATETELDRLNDRVLRAAARAHRLSGVPISTHAGATSRMGLEQQRIFQEEGVDLSRVIIGHCDDTDDLSYHEAIIENGSYCGLDRFGLESPATTEDRIKVVVSLVERGYADRLVLSHDATCYSDALPPEALAGVPNWHYCYLPQTIIPELRRRGVSSQAIDQMTIHNPHAIFSHNTAY